MRKIVVRPHLVRILTVTANKNEWRWCLPFDIMESYKVLIRHADGPYITIKF